MLTLGTKRTTTLIKSKLTWAPQCGQHVLHSKMQAMPKILSPCVLELVNGRDTCHESAKKIFMALGGRGDVGVSESGLSILQRDIRVQKLNLSLWML